MPGTGPIPGLMVSKAKGTDQGRSIGTVNATMQPTDAGTKDDSYRWLFEREVDRLRWRDPRHVEPELLRRPGQGE